MPKLYEYFGIIVLFYSNEHDPIHVHAKFQDKEHRAEITVVNGKIKEIRFGRAKGRKPLTGAKLEDFKKLVNKYAGDIVKKWVDFFIYNKPITPKKITKAIK
jgi:hypothetical protein